MADVKHYALRSVLTQLGQSFQYQTDKNTSQYPQSIQPQPFSPY